MDSTVDLEQIKLHIRQMSVRIDMLEESLRVVLLRANSTAKTRQRPQYFARIGSTQWEVLQALGDKAIYPGELIGLVAARLPIRKPDNRRQAARAAIFALKKRGLLQEVEARLRAVSPVADATLEDLL